ncbi:hypothetical protein ABT272_40745 [Streptomyces sp900105245]|uniref:Uncharacterized protein n=1 Tax=Streptomyces sp. 900105245 TaxID=3154379 RepID=A0ABV1UJU1_9ACTN
MNPVHLVDAVRKNRDVAGTAVLRAGPPTSVPGGTGVATLCLGVGQGLALARVLPPLALVLER